MNRKVKFCIPAERKTGGDHVCWALFTASAQSCLKHQTLVAWDTPGESGGPSGRISSLSTTESVSPGAPGVCCRKGQANLLLDLFWAAPWHPPQVGDTFGWSRVTDTWEQWCIQHQHGRCLPMPVWGRSGPQSSAHEAVAQLQMWPQLGPHCWVCPRPAKLMGWKPNPSTAVLGGGTWKRRLVLRAALS